MGVTGTLESVSQVQRRIIVEDFKIYEETYIPSVFGDRQLTFSEDKDVIVSDTSKCNSQEEQQEAFFLDIK